MSSERERDAGMDRLLRAALEPQAAAEAGACPDAGVIAAYTEGGLTADERAGIEAHVAGCARCQSVLAVMVREEPDVSAAPAGWWAWLSVPRLRWLVPAAAAALGVLLYVAVKPPASGPADGGAAPTAAVSPASPEFTIAQRLEERPIAPAPGQGTDAVRRTPTTRTPAPPAEPVSAKPIEEKREPPGRPDVFAPQPEAAPGKGVGVAAEAPAAQAPAAPAPAPPVLVAAAPPAPTPVAEISRARKEAPAAPAGAAAPPSANQAVMARADERETAAVTADAARSAELRRDKSAPMQKKVLPVEYRLVTPEPGLDNYWAAADVVVRARALAVRPAFLHQERAATAFAAGEPLVPADFEVIEVFKRSATAAPVPRFVLMQVGSEAEDATTIYRVPDDVWVRIRPGSEYVLFLVRSMRAGLTDTLNPVGGPYGIYLLEGGRVTIGNGAKTGPVPTTSELLARLRQLAGTSRRTPGA